MADPAAPPAPIAAIGRAASQCINDSFHPAERHAVLVYTVAAVGAFYRCGSTFQLDTHWERQD